MNLGRCGYWMMNCTNFTHDCTPVYSTALWNGHVLEFSTMDVQSHWHWQRACMKRRLHRWRSLLDIDSRNKHGTVYSLKRTIYLFAGINRSLCLRVTQKPRSQDLAILVVTTDRQTDSFTPLHACAYGQNIVRACSQLTPTNMDWLTSSYDLCDCWLSALFCEEWEWVSEKVRD